jgi:hypothetical protein
VIEESPTIHKASFPEERGRGGEGEWRGRGEREREREGREEDSKRST